MSATLLCLLCSIFNPVLSVGPDAMHANPAQLAYPERPAFACRILDLDAGIGNNSFSLSQYNRYTGAYLDEHAKVDILGSIPLTGVRARLDARASAAEFGYGSIAVSVRTTGTGEVNLPRDAFDLALRGNALNRSYVADMTQGRAEVLWRAGLSVASAIGSHFAAGVGVHHLSGLFYAEVTDAAARFGTTRDALTSSGKFAYRRASGGEGWAFDLGGAYLCGPWRVSLAALDVSPGIVWDEGVEQGIYTFVLDSSNGQEISSGGRLKQQLVKDNPGFFTTAVPLTMNLGAGRRVFDWFNCGVMLQQRLLAGPFERNWSASTFAEFWPLVWLPLGCELGYRGGTGLVLGLQAAAIARRFVFTVGVEDRAGLLLGAKGVAYHIGIGYATFYNELGNPRKDTLYMRTD